MPNGTTHAGRCPRHAGGSVGHRRLTSPTARPDRKLSESPRGRALLKRKRSRFLRTRRVELVQRRGYNAAACYVQSRTSPVGSRGIRGRRVRTSWNISRASARAHTTSTARAAPPRALEPDAGSGSSVLSVTATDGARLRVPPARPGSRALPPLSPRTRQLELSEVVAHLRTGRSRDQRGKARSGANGVQVRGPPLCCTERRP
jgi:hypothetical protein